MTVRTTTSAQQCAVKLTKERVGCLGVLDKKVREEGEGKIRLKNGRNYAFFTNRKIPKHH